ncbi:hypothetical protein KC332_g13909 [Hortaea werneckii]|uniref:Uncharacterized protein n=2 Tax=Hortaea werneckii TaxID=91943 RepID=A0A3M7I3S1_HORWE|nr:hypothetical protein KC350_g16051 [Hortaea werneckii]OTA25817.1 hypothetical protein BTJ68_10298 [Hortaea werneckii EXF-2000]KAI6808690.1 hypothetical protein KC358_g12912 [Hortaea werneckii]KAI6907175.1 hypothetical protein KC348_g14344 [Hortaea werneckii]KAI6931036.1 hypothetical protein KC341_g9847 [Hortaea werneckii]
MGMLERRDAWLATLTSLLVRQAVAQSCYYPNGDLAEGMAACSTDGGACCPFQWECLSNGLCYLGNADYYGRYTCTDQSWSNSTCPGLCTQGDTASGNEAILQCADGSWCCDGNRSFDCCEDADSLFFDLSDGTSIAYISSVPSASATASSSSEDRTETTTTSSYFVSDPTSSSNTETSSELAEASPTAQPSQTTSSTPITSSSPSPSTTEAPSTITSQALTTGTNGAASTLYIISTVVPEPDPIYTPLENSPSSSSSSSSEPTPPNLPLILSTAIGLPVLLLACSLLIYLLWKRHRRRTLNKPRHPNSPPGEIDEKFGSQVGHLPPDGRAPELDSFPVAMTVRRSPSGRKSELEGSSSSSAGTGVSSSPAISSLGGGAGTGGRLSQFGGGGGQGSPLSPGLQSVREEQQQQQQEPYELWGGYVPYRPPQSAQEVGKPGGGGYYGDEEKPGMSQ